MMHAIANIAFEVALAVAIVAGGFTIWHYWPRILMALDKRDQDGL